MVKICPVCNHTGELTWRDGKYYCAMCGSEVPETQPQAQTHAQPQTQPSATVHNVTCPICKNRENNLFDGSKYSCALCGTSFDLQQEVPSPSYGQPYGANNTTNGQKPKLLKKEKDKYMLLGIVFLFIFWPVSIYFFYKFYQLYKLEN